MEARRICDVVRDVLDQIHLLSNVPVDYTAIPPTKKVIVMLQQVESRIAFNQLLKLLRENTQCLDELTPITAQPFNEFLSERWNVISQTDSAYPMSPTLPINRACLLLATALSGAQKKHPYDLLMPTIPFDQYELAPHGSLYNFKLHEFVLGNDGSPLSVELCFRFLVYKAEFNRSKSNSAKSPRSSNSKGAFDPPMKSLNMEDEQLISKHSAAANHYFDAISLNTNESECQAAFLEVLKSDHYDVLASYGEVGKMRLMEVILKGLRSPLGMAEFLYTYVPKPCWKDFLSAIHKNDLFNIVLGVDLVKLQTQLGDTELFKKMWLQQTDEILALLVKGRFEFANEDQLRALIMCLLETYRVSRKEGPDYKSSAGYYVGSFFSLAQSKDEKLLSADVFRDFLLSDPPHPLIDLAGYLQARQLAEKHLASLTTQSRLTSNILPSLVMLAANTARQFYRQKKSTATTYGTLSLTQ